MSKSKNSLTVAVDFGGRHVDTSKQSTKLWLQLVYASLCYSYIILLCVVDTYSEYFLPVYLKTV